MRIGPGRPISISWQALLLLAGAAALIIADALLGAAYGWGLAAGLLVAVSGWAAALGMRWMASRRAQAVQRERQEQISAAQSNETALLAQREADHRRLELLLRLNRGLIEAQDEHRLMETALSAVSGLAGALGCSFVPVDEWDQPLPAFTHGRMPEPVLRAWATHLADNMLRERCATCLGLESSPGGCPLHPEQVGPALTIHCLELNRGERRLGLLNLYLPAGQALDDTTRGLIENLLPVIAFAYENARLRAQETATLRQLQMLHAPVSDFSTSLGGLIDGLRGAIEADYVMVRLRADTPEALAGLNVTRGSGCKLDEALLAQILTRAAAGVEQISEPGSLPAWMAAPLVAPAAGAGGSAVLGTLLAVVDRPHVFHPRQQAIIQTVAAQAALLVENERLLRSLEYKVVIQERARLAREIHDGLAQTLAFLKLQAAQMQSYLAQGDLHRLGEVLKDNYQALAEAYLDARQSIDNLHLNPQESLEAWLEHSLDEFAAATGMRVERSIQPLGRRVAPEIQAQLIRVVQESLSNVRKHSRARRIRVSLRVWEGTLLLEIQDDGQGFDVDDLPEVSRHGLRGMRERSEMIGADLQIISRPAEGVTVALSLPLPLEEEENRL